MMLPRTGQRACSKAIPRLETVSLPGERGHGFAMAVNVGLARARGDVLVLLNNDAVPEPGWLAELMGGLERNPWAGMAASKLLLYDRPGHVPLHGGLLRAGRCAQQPRRVAGRYRPVRPRGGSVRAMRRGGRLQAVCSCGCRQGRRDEAHGTRHGPGTVDVLRGRGPQPASALAGAQDGVRAHREGSAPLERNGWRAIGFVLCGPEHDICYRQGRCLFPL